MKELLNQFIYPLAVALISIAFTKLTDNWTANHHTKLKNKKSHRQK